MGRGGGGGGRGGGGGGGIPSTPRGWTADHENGNLYFKTKPIARKQNRRATVFRREGESKYYLSTRFGVSPLGARVRQPFNSLSAAAAAGRAWVNRGER